MSLIGTFHPANNRSRKVAHASNETIITGAQVMTYQREIPTTIYQFSKLLPSRDGFDIGESYRLCNGSIWYAFVSYFFETYKTLLIDENILTAKNHAVESNCAILIVSNNDCVACLGTLLVGFWTVLVKRLEDLEFAIDGVDWDVPELSVWLCSKDGLEIIGQSRRLLLAGGVTWREQTYKVDWLCCTQVGRHKNTCKNCDTHIVKVIDVVLMSLA